MALEQHHPLAEAASLFFPSGAVKASTSGRIRAERLRAAHVAGKYISHRETHCRMAEVPHMPRPRKDPRLYLEPARKDRAAVYRIYDGKKRIGTGCGKADTVRAHKPLPTTSPATGNHRVHSRSQNC